MEVLPYLPNKAWQIIKCLSHHLVHELCNMGVLNFCLSLPFLAFPGFYETWWDSCDYFWERVKNCMRKKALTNFWNSNFSSLFLTTKSYTLELGVQIIFILVCLWKSLENYFSWGDCCVLIRHCEVLLWTLETVLPTLSSVNKVNPEKQKIQRLKQYSFNRYRDSSKRKLEKE